MHMRKIILSCFILINMSVAAQLTPVPSGVIHWNDLEIKKDGMRESRKLAEGTTPEFGYFEIHATTQAKGAPPKPVHTQKDIEELIIIKEGTMKCVVGDQTAELSTGSILLIPPMESQYFENIGDGPLTYYVLMFRSGNMDMERSKKAGGSLLLNIDSTNYTEKAGRGTRPFFDRPTAMCANFEMHTTRLTAIGPSHAPHQHVDTEIILIIDGSVSMDIDGSSYTGVAGDLFLVESGKMHGVKNATEQPCNYYAFKWR